jgi:hypothetical protein
MFKQNMLAIFSTWIQYGEAQVCQWWILGIMCRSILSGRWRKNFRWEDGADLVRGRLMIRELLQSAFVLTQRTPFLCGSPGSSSCPWVHRAHHVIIYAQHKQAHTHTSRARSYSVISSNSIHFGLHSARGARGIHISMRAALAALYVPYIKCPYKTNLNIP